MTTKAEQKRNLINIRRSAVRELLIKGYTSGAEISRALNVSEPTISRDIAWFNKWAKKDFDTFLQKRLAGEFYKTIDSYDYVIRIARHTADSTQDEKTKMEALRLVRDTRAAKMDLLSNVDVMNYQANKNRIVVVEHTTTTTDTVVEEKELEQNADRE
jgi:transcriptional antiterminator